MKTITAVDLFCGAGGTSTGLIQAAESLGKKVELTAINHWDKAIETHKTNHAEVRHLCENLDNVNPRALFPQGRINLLVASPECTHHSNARGGVPCSDQSRATAWRVVDWAAAIYIDNILIENVPEFMSWGPLGANGKPMKSKKGATFWAFKVALESLGYRVDHRVLNAADYGDPTCRNRFFLIARRGNKKIRWPEQTHAEDADRDLFGHNMKPWVPARKIIDWSIQGQSIFNRKKPLAEKTLARIEYGLRKFGGEDSLIKFFGSGNSVSLDKPLGTVMANGKHHGLVQPFVTIIKGMSKTRGVDKPLPTLTTKQQMYLCEPFLIDRNYSHAGSSRVRSLDRPAPTLTTRPGQAIVEPFILPQQQGAPGQLRVRSIDKPMPSMTTTGAEQLVEPFIVKYFGTGTAKSVNEPLDTVTTKDRFGLVEIFEKTQGLDIRLRMLQPHELAAAQSFPDDYKFCGNKGEVIKQIGNAVPGRIAKALCRELIS
ncbi:DNA cytosine methyltransferase [Desulfobacter postgatei]|uniref:DNA cytosine methyltransferase n=1 Tax=Desulfobacter postgatei TaxID=2293 RepID=UPI00259AF7F6|nr:DNA cytosine methyltransferase [uncultured Desulfobacter sp.]